MNNSFDNSKSHEDNVKISIEKIIGQPTSSKRVKKTNDEIRKGKFRAIMEMLQFVEERQIIMNEMHGIDMIKHNEPFFQIIDEFFALLFNKEQIKLINFYLYDRYTADGAVLSLLDENDNAVPLETPDQLWDILSKVK